MARRALIPAESLDDVFDRRRPKLVIEQPDDEAPPPEPAAFPEYAAGFDQPKRYKVVYGGRGAGRSWTIARKLLLRAHARPIRILCTRELQTSIRDSVHRLLKDQAALLGLPFEATDRQIRHANGSMFIFEGLRYNVQKIKSLEGIDICWVEEGERISHQSWSVLQPTIRRPDAEIWVSFNPDQESDPTYQMFVVNPRPDAWVKKVSWQDNPWFPDTLRAEKDYLYSVDPDAAAHIWGGECRHASDAQILRGKWVMDRFEAQPNWDGPYQGIDFGFAQSPTTMVRCWIHQRTLYVEHEAYKIGLELDHTADFFRNHVPDCHKYVSRADSARPESISYLQRHGMPRIVGVKKWQGSVEDGIAHLRQYEKIIIHERCTHTIDEARHYSYKVDERTADVLPVVVDQHNHCIDPMRYALAPLIKSPMGAWGTSKYTL